MIYTANIKVLEANEASLTDTKVRISRTERSLVLVRFQFRPLLANTDIVVVGGGGVSAKLDTDDDEAAGLILWPWTDGSPWFDVPEGADMYNWWLDARVSDEGVSLTGFRKPRAR